MRRWLVSLDTDRIKEYVFGTGRLREIRGATTILDWLNRYRTPQQLGQGTLIYAGGGSAMAVFADEDDAQRFRAEIEALYPEESGATITGVVVAFDEGVSVDAPNSFASAVRQAAHQLRRAKLSGQEPVQLLAHSLWRRCERCGQYPATRRMQGVGVTLELCDRCAIQRAEPDINVEETQASYRPERRLVKAAGEQWSGEVRFASQLDEMGSHIGLIYADGNDVGRVVEEQMTEPNNLRAFSQVLENAALAALIAATRPYWNQDREVLPFLPIVLGGDDLLVLATGESAFPIAASLSSHFQNEVRVRSKERKEQGEMRFEGEALDVSMSVGVAIAHTTYPLFALEELAEQLLRSAKRYSMELRRMGLGEVGTLDFRVISTSSADPWEQVREREYRLMTPPGALEQWGTARPYPVLPVEGLQRPAWSDVESGLRRLKASRFPRNKLNAWRDLLWVEPSLQAQLELSAMLSRLTREQQKEMEAIARQLGLSDVTQFFFTDPVQMSHRLSPLPDLVEVYDFIREAE